MWKEVFHGYLVVITYADAVIRRVLDALHKSLNSNNAIAVILSYNGYALGEKHVGENILFGKEQPAFHLFGRIREFRMESHMMGQLIFPTLLEVDRYSCFQLPDDRWRITGSSFSES